MLGLYYLTKAKPGAKGEGRAFANIEEVMLALEAGEVETLTPIRLRYTGEVIDLTTAYDDQDVMHTEPVHFERQFINTTVGRVIFNDASSRRACRSSTACSRRRASAQLVNYCYLRFGLEGTVKMLDEVKELASSTRPRRHVDRHRRHGHPGQQERRWSSDAEKEVVNVQQQYLDGAITNGERYNKVIEIWSDITEKVADEMFRQMQRARQGRQSSTRFTSWPTPAPAVRNSRFASFPVCAD